ncbi:hypothetical protein [Maricaulis sp.]|uniref:M61 family metallopeptidase n=1 Tax=Maricaulis sp. TaxID=1486257 RepID=UPI0025BD1B56|nr:hypothetical protein [Maricaulis sp.]
MKTLWLIAGAVMSAAGGSAWAQSVAECGPDPVASYVVTYLGEDRFGVAVEHAVPSNRWDLAFFPLSDRPEGQAESVRDLSAFDANGQPVEIAYVGEGGWEIDGQGAVRLSYTILADHGEVDWGADGPGKDEVGDHFDDSYVFAGHAFFLLDWAMPRCAVDVQFDLPDAWQVTAPWPVENGVYRIADSWSLGQNLFAMGEDAARTVQVGGLNLTWLMDKRLGAITPQVERVMAILPQHYRDFWGQAPGNAFSVFFMADTMSDGGAFYDSFAMRIAVPLNRADEINWSHTLAHEVMHLWNQLGRAQGRNVPELEWVNEGFTDYLTIKMASQAGILDEAMTEQRLANLIRRFNLARTLSPEVSIAAAGQDKPANWHLIYGGGGLAALFIDAELSRTDPDRFGAVLRDLQANAGDGYTFETFMDRFDGLTDGLASQVYDWLDMRPSNAEIVQRLGRYGIEAATFGMDEAYVRFEACGDARCAPVFLAAR